MVEEIVVEGLVHMYLSLVPIGMDMVNLHCDAVLGKPIEMLLAVALHVAIVDFVV